MQILPEDRTETVEDLRDELSASPAAAGTAAEAYSSLYASHEDDYEDDTPSAPPLSDDEDGEYEEYEEEENTGLKKSTIVAFVVSAVVCLAVLIGVLVGFKGCSGNDTDNTTTSLEDGITTEEKAETEEETEIGNVSIKIPNFVGKFYDDIKDDDKYKQVLKFETEYVDSKEERGKIISQSLNAGTEVTSLNPRTITLKISDGLEVPDVVGKSMKDAIDILKGEGFKNIKTESGKVASNSAESNSVYRVVFDDPESNDWAEIPDDRRLSANDTLIIYYYGEYSESTTATQPETTEETTQQTEPDTTEDDTAVNSDEESVSADNE